MPHNFKDFPELTNAQMQFYYFESPHKQIFEDFHALCVKVHDGDTITLRWNERNFDFPIRFINIEAPELSEEKGKESKKWLEEKLKNEEVEILINSKIRVEKWGRLLGNIIFRGVDIGEESIFTGHSVPWENRNDGKIKDFNMELKNAIK